MCVCVCECVCVCAITFLMWQCTPLHVGVCLCDGGSGGRGEEVECVSSVQVKCLGAAS